MGPVYPTPWKWDLYILPPDMGPGEPTPLLLTSGGRHWRHVQMCSLEDLTPRPSHYPHCQYRHLMVATETCTVGKWVVRILLECCLILDLLGQLLQFCSRMTQNIKTVVFSNEQQVS